MKRSYALIAAIAVALTIFAGCQPTKTEAPVAEQPAAAQFHIGIVTGTVSQGEDDLAGANAIMAKYGKVEDGGMVKHVTYPDNFGSEVETVISRIVELSNDPLMKAIIVNQSVPGTAEAFNRIRKARPDIKLYAGQPQEDMAIIEKAADIVVEPDFLARGYTIIWAAKELGAKSFVHISFKRHMGIQSLAVRREIMKQACADLGLKFFDENAPDPTTDVGVPGAQKFILDNVPKWIAKYGKDTAFFCTNDAHTEPLLMQLLKFGGCFVEADLPSPILGYPGALGVDLSAEKGNFDAIIKKEEAEIVKQGGAGRFGTWAVSIGYVTSAGLCEYAVRVQKGEAKLDSMKDLLDAFATYTPGARWNASYNVDAATGANVKNHLLVYQDTYIFGKGFLETTKLTVPEKYFKIKL